MPDEIILVCSRATARLVAPGSIFTEKCARCKNNVAIAPSGQRFKKEHPEAAIVCMFCLKEGELDQCLNRTAANRDELRAEIAGAQPNTWRDRN